MIHSDWHKFEQQQPGCFSRPWIHFVCFFFCRDLPLRPFLKRWTPSGGSSSTSTSTTSREALWTSQCGTKMQARRTTSWEGTALRVWTRAACWSRVNLNVVLRACLRVSAQVHHWPVAPEQGTDAQTGRAAGRRPRSAAAAGHTHRLGCRLHLRPVGQHAGRPSWETPDHAALRKFGVLIGRASASCACVLWVRKLRSFEVNFIDVKRQKFRPNLQAGMSSVVIKKKSV